MPHHCHCLLAVTTLCCGALQTAMARTKAAASCGVKDGGGAGSGPSSGAGGRSPANPAKGVKARVKAAAAEAAAAMKLALPQIIASKFANLSAGVTQAAGPRPMLAADWRQQRSPGAVIQWVSDLRVFVARLVSACAVGAMCPHLNSDQAASSNAALELAGSVHSLPAQQLATLTAVAEEVLGEGLPALRPDCVLTVRWRGPPPAAAYHGTAPAAPTASDTATAPAAASTGGAGDSGDSASGSSGAPPARWSEAEVQHCVGEAITCICRQLVDLIGKLEPHRGQPHWQLLRLSLATAVCRLLSVHSPAMRQSWPPTGEPNFQADLQHAAVARASLAVLVDNSHSRQEAFEDARMATLRQPAVQLVALRVVLSFLACRCAVVLGDGLFASNGTGFLGGLIS